VLELLDEIQKLAGLIAAALCPNCHRRVHAGADGATNNAELLERMHRL
jgi:hypothetical protein